MKKSLSLWQLAGFTFTAVLGTLFHFLYDWTNFILLAPFCAVNESTWEHVKILFFPMLIFALIQNRFFADEYPRFWRIKLVGTLLGVALIPVLFYTYNGAFGKSPDWVNIAIFFLAAGIAYLVEFILFKQNDERKTSSVLPFVILSLVTVLFVLFTFFPPQIPLFQDPISGRYGLNAT